MKLLIGPRPTVRFVCILHRGRYPHNPNKFLLNKFWGKKVIEHIFLLFYSVCMSVYNWTSGKTKRSKNFNNITRSFKMNSKIRWFAGAIQI